MKVKVRIEKKSRKKVNNVQGFQMPEMNDPFYTTPEFLGIASGGQVKTDDQRRYAEILCMCKCSASLAGIKNVNHVEWLKANGIIEEKWSMSSSIFWKEIYRF